MCVYFFLFFIFSSCESVGARKGFIIVFQMCVCVRVGVRVGCQSLPRPAAAPSSPPLRLGGEGDRQLSIT